MNLYKSVIIQRSDENQKSIKTSPRNHQYLQRKNENDVIMEDRHYKFKLTIKYKEDFPLEGNFRADIYILHWIIFPVLILVFNIFYM